MRPSRRVDLHLCPSDPERSPPVALDAVWAGWGDAGGIDAEGLPGPAAGSLIRGGFVRARIDRPGRVALYANAQGGFRAYTPRGAPVTPAAFQAAVQAARAGGPRVIVVDSEVWALEALTYEPPAAWARWAIVFAGVESLEEGPAMVAADDALGPLVRVARRVG